MKRSLLTLSLLLFLFSGCAQAGNIDAKSEDTAAPTGKLYLRTTFWGTSLTITWVYLGNDGTIIRDPKYGVNPINLAGESTNNANNTGTYKIGAEKISITWKNGKNEEWGFEKTKGEFSSLDGGLTTLQQPLAANYKLDGKFLARAATANLSSSSTLVFTPDGKFTEANVGTVSTAETGAISKKSNAGTYTITGNTLKMNYEDGKNAISVITVMMIGSKKYLVIDGSFYPQQ